LAAASSRCAGDSRKSNRRNRSPRGEAPRLLTTLKASHNSLWWIDMRRSPLMAVLWITDEVWEWAVMALPCMCGNRGATMA
jgi:hypothetical protein